MSHYSIDDMHGTNICGGIQLRHKALEAAQEDANRLGEPVYLYEHTDDGTISEPEEVSPKKEEAPVNEKSKYLDDIPLALAKSAHNGTSHVPEERAEQERAGFAATLERDYTSLAEGLGPELLALLETEFATYRSRYATLYCVYLQARSRCVSTMIVGGSNFPVARQKKRGATADRRMAEAAEFRIRALAAIRKKLHPEDGPIMAGDDNAIEALQKKLVEHEAKQAHMKAVNACIRRHAKRTPKEQAEFLALVVKSHTLAEELLKEDPFGNRGYAPYQLTNNNATIRAVKARIEAITKAKASPTIELTGTKARFEDNPPENRVRLFFASKPDEATRSRLKAAGFRWTPSLEAWQAYRNHHSMVVAKQEAGIGHD